MKLVPVLALFLFAACSAGAASNVAGTYVIDTKALVANAPTADKENAKAAAEMMQKMFEGTSMELAANGTATFKTNMGGKPEEDKGTWKLDGDKITITTKDSASGKDEIKTGKYHDGTITVDITEAGMPIKQMVFRKK